MRGLFAITMMLGLCLSGGVMGARPLVVDDAGVVEVGELEVEAGLEFVSQRRTWNLSAPAAVTYGLVEDIDVAVDFGYQYEVRRERGESRERVDGLLDTVLSLKWGFREQGDGLPAMAAVPSVKIPTASEGRGLGDGKWDIGLTLIGTWEWERVAVDVNAGYTFADGFRPPLREGELFVGTAVRGEMSEGLWVVGEVFGAAPGGTVRRTSGVVAGGVQYERPNGLVLDAAIGTGIGRDRPRLLLGAGLTWAF